MQTIQSRLKLLELKANPTSLHGLIRIVEKRSGKYFYKDKEDVEHEYVKGEGSQFENLIILTDFSKE